MNRSKKIRVLAALGSLSGAVWAGTFATFTDDATASATFTTGTVDLQLDDDPDGNDLRTVNFSADNMRPGDVRFATLKVENAGTIASTYVMTSTESEAALSGELQLGAVVGAVTCDQTGYAAATNVATGGLLSNQVIASGDLSAAAIGAVTPRPLAAGAAETLCFRVELPSGTTNTFQGLTTTSTFAFVLTQS